MGLFCRHVSNLIYVASFRRSNLQPTGVFNDYFQGKSTLSAIINLVESIIDSIEEGQFVTALFLDYSKAFDCLGHNLISPKTLQPWEYEA
ncbi:hypothetical protein J6590_060833 [Homalodisca vitripennis]|nr:hypothetical protein J6590_060833 [Homalodisca vitripennis]